MYDQISPHLAFARRETKGDKGIQSRAITGSYFYSNSTTKSCFSFLPSFDASTQVTITEFFPSEQESKGGSFGFLGSIWVV